MKLITYTQQESQVADFVEFWDQQYNYPLEHLYTTNIGQPFSAIAINELFHWKNGSVLSATKLRSVERNYVAHIANVNALPRETDAASFLRTFPNGGAIWRIFWLHCWQPGRFPIYDQHVHRAMVFIEQQRIEQIPARDSEKVRDYLTKYLPFHRKFQGISHRSLDKALWVYGKFLKAYQFP
jgi:hypothetical protein